MPRAPWIVPDSPRPASHPRTLLDTDIFSELMRGKNEVVRARADAYVKQHGRLTISAVTVLEVAKGFQKAGRQDALDNFLGRLSLVEVFPMGPDEALVGGRIYGDLERVGQPIGRADPMIAGIAIAHGLVLASGNEEHYARIRAAGYVRLSTTYQRGTPDVEVTGRASGVRLARAACHLARLGLGGYGGGAPSGRGRAAQRARAAAPAGRLATRS